MTEEEKKKLAEVLEELVSAMRWYTSAGVQSFTKTNLLIKQLKGERKDGPAI